MQLTLCTRIDMHVWLYKHISLSQTCTYKHTHTPYIWACCTVSGAWSHTKITQRVTVGTNSRLSFRVFPQITACDTRKPTISVNVCDCVSVSQLCLNSYHSNFCPSPVNFFTKLLAHSRQSVAAGPVQPWHEVKHDWQNILPGSRYSEQENMFTWSNACNVSMLINLS